MPDGQIEHRVTSGSNVELQEVLADVVRNHQGCSNIVDLTGQTFKGRLSGPLKIPSNTTLRGGTIELQESAPFNNSQQVRVLGASGVSFENLCIKGPRNEAFVVFCEGSRVKMLGCVIEGGNLAAVMLRGSLDASRTPVGGGRLGTAGRHARPASFSLRTRMAGDLLTGSSSLFARDCTFFSPEEHGLKVTDSSQAVLADCRADKCGGWGWAIEDGARLVAQGCSASSCGGVNVGVNNAATADLKRCKLSDGQGIGLIADGSSTVTCIDCAINGNEDTNVHVIGKSRVTVQGCDCGQSKEGHGVCVEEEGSWLEARDSDICGCRSFNAVVRAGSDFGTPPGAGAVLRLTQCVLNDSPECGLKMMGGTATAMLCQFSNNAQGNMVVEGAVCSPVAAVIDCEARDSSEGSGLYVWGAGALLKACNTAVCNNAKPIMVVDRAVLEMEGDCIVK